MLKKGLFITIEGCEGAGKSTQANFLAESLRGLKYTVVVTREPGGTAIGEKIRQVLLDRGNQALSPRGELLLYLASRAQLVGQVIAPALAEGGIVISDRFHHSTLAYQGGARELDLDLVRRLNHFATGGVLPDVTFLLDLAPEVGLARRGAESAVDRLEGEGIGFHEKVRQAFLALAREEPARIVVLDAQKPAGTLAEAILGRVIRLLNELRD